jgi:hypothetical protein
MFQDLDEALMTFVNGLSVFVFFAIVGYHYITVRASLRCDEWNGWMDRSIDRLGDVAMSKIDGSIEIGWVGGGGGWRWGEEWGGGVGQSWVDQSITTRRATGWVTTWPGQSIDQSGF